MNAVEIEEAISQLAEQPFDAAEFPYTFLLAFGNKETTIKRLRAGSSNKSDLGGVLQTSNTPVRHQPHGLDFELVAELPSRHICTPVPWSRSYLRVHETGSSSLGVRMIRPDCDAGCLRPPGSCFAGVGCTVEAARAKAESEKQSKQAEVDQANAERYMKRLAG